MNNQKRRPAWLDCARPMAQPPAAGLTRAEQESSNLSADGHSASAQSDAGDALAAPQGRKAGSTRPSRCICVYCGSCHGDDPAYVEAARSLGQTMAQRGIGLIYGGGDLGLMGTVAHAALEAGGHVTGIIPAFLRRREKMLHDLSELIVTQNMHERKMLMFEAADGFIALPGGIGTLEELVEQLTWVQLGRHGKPIVAVNTLGFWSPLTAMLEHMRSHGFIRETDDVALPLMPTPQAAVDHCQAVWAGAPPRSRDPGADHGETVRDVHDADATIKRRM